MNTLYLSVFFAEFYLPAHPALVVVAGGLRPGTLSQLPRRAAERGPTLHIPSNL